MELPLKIQRTPKSTQPFLFIPKYSGVITTDGEARVRMGLRIENLVCDLLHLTNIPINGQYDVNFDAGHYTSEGEIFFEIKSVQQGGHSIIYLFRLEKELAAQKQTGCPVFYLFCTHKVKGVISQDAITQGLLSGAINIYAVPLNLVNKLSKDLRVRKVHSHTLGYGRKGYCDGYISFPTKDLPTICDYTFHCGVQIDGKHKSIKVHGTRHYLW